MSLLHDAYIIAWLVAGAVAAFCCITAPLINIQQYNEPEPEENEDHE